MVEDRAIAQFLPSFLAGVHYSFLLRNLDYDNSLTVGFSNGKGSSQKTPKADKAEATCTSSP